MAYFLRLEGHSSYQEVHQLQQDLLTRRANNEIGDVILFLEHAPVITVGRARNAQDNILSPDNTEVVSVERGGDVTWHGPGQLVAYPIIKLEDEKADLHRHLNNLEQAVIDLLAELGLPAQRDDRNTGVWIQPADKGLPRKVCSIGIACRKWVTWHGLALNITTDLSVFQQIRPCGFTANIMTRLVDETNTSLDLDIIASRLAFHLARHLDLDVHTPIQSCPTHHLTDVLATMGIAN